MKEHSAGKKIANILLNISKEEREWIMNNVSPITLGRWSRQTVIALDPYRNLKEKVKAIASGADNLSELAQFEKQQYDNGIY